MIVRNYLLFICFAFLTTACSAVGKHIVVNGQCLACDNAADSSQASGAYPKLTWHELMLEGLTRNGSNDVSMYGEDYLRYNIGNKVVSLKNNEFAYKREVDAASKQLKNELQNHQLESVYQVTLPITLGDYNFDKEEFPITRFSDSFKLKARNGITHLPGDILVTIENMDKISALKMNATAAEAFLNSRNNSRRLHLRLIFSITEMSLPTAFHVKVREIQFVNVAASLGHNIDVERHPAFKSVRL